MEYEINDFVNYDNFGKDFRLGETYIITDVEKHGYMIGNSDTSPFFAYEYQLQKIK